MNSFHVSILAADEPLYEGPCQSLVVPMEDGQYGVMAGHINVIGAIVPGKLTYLPPEGSKRIAAVSYGIFKVEDGNVLVMVNSAEHLEEIDVARARRDAEEARRILLEKRSQREYEAARIDLARAMNRLRVHGHEEE